MAVAGGAKEPSRPPMTLLQTDDAKGQLPIASPPEPPPQETMEGAQEGMMERLHLDDAAYFIYIGQEDVPKDVIRVRVHRPSG